MGVQSDMVQIEIGKLEKHIGCIKYTLFSLNVITWMIGAAMFATAIWLRVEPGFQEWVKQLEIEQYYIGIYIIIIVAVVVLVVSFIGCAAALMENVAALLAFIGTQVGSFLLGTIGTAVLLEYSTHNSKIQPIIRDVMMRLIMNSHSEMNRETLAVIQENIGCCGADGANDYLVLRQPLPTQCRDAVTGNVYFYGCVDELTWFMESRSTWLSAITLALSFLCVINTVLSIVLIQALKKEEDEATNALESTKGYN